jgi:(4S)-4-hydroxy-5-phosphonooxypentane-2,3-dione isomerase
MHIIQVFAQVKPEFIDAFRDACVENALNSVQEPGVVRFDVMQSTDDPSRFSLIEIYRTPDDPPAHRETTHYKKWRETVDPMMAEQRSKVEYRNIFPTDHAWR